MLFLFDAQMPKRLANGLQMLDNDNLAQINVEIVHADDVCGQGTPDPDIIKKAAELSAVIVSEDDDFKRLKANKQLIKQLNVGYVLYKPPRHGSRYWEKAVAFILAWENLKTKIRTLQPPFILNVDKKGNIQQEL